MHESVEWAPGNCKSLPPPLWIVTTPWCCSLNATFTLEPNTLLVRHIRSFRSAFRSKKLVSILYLLQPVVCAVLRKWEVKLQSRTGYLMYNRVLLRLAHNVILIKQRKCGCVYWSWNAGSHEECQTWFLELIHLQLSALLLLYWFVCSSVRPNLRGRREVLLATLTFSLCTGWSAPL